VAVLLVIVLGTLAVAGLGFYYVRGTANQAVAAERRAMAEMQRARAQQQVQPAATPDPRLLLEVVVDREGSATIDGKEIELAEFRNRLVELKKETANVFSVRIVAEPDCPAKHLVAVLDACHEVGDIDCRVSVRNAEEEIPLEPKG
jgi:biopolymer transport protein ExbD